VQERTEFAWLEVAASGPVLRTHHLRETGIAFALRHQTADVLALDELFSQKEYDLPGEVKNILSLHRPLRVLDLGANIGLFGAWILGLFRDVEITSVEADPDNARVLAATISANRGTTWKLIEAAASTRAGTVQFVSEGRTTSHLARAGESGIEVPTVDVFELAGDADLLKIDIEGGEWELLDDPRFPSMRPAVLVLEYHQEGCPAADPRIAAEERLRRSGLQIASVRIHAEHGTGLIWALLEAAKER
jgi:FkbM family methyltransferase